MSGFSVMTGKSIDGAIKQSIRYKQIIPKAKIVWGGIHPSLLPEQTISEPFIDYVFVGEGEHTLLELIQYLHSDNIDIKEIQGLVYKENERILRNQPRHFIKILNELPDPAWHLVDIVKYFEITLNTNRGCPYRGTFCYNSSFNKGRRSDFSTTRIVS